MKSIHGKAFLDVWRALYHEGNPRLALDRWRIEGVDWVRETHGFQGRDYGFRIESHTLRHDGRPGWSVLVVIERWWAAGRKDDIRSTVWRQILSGRAADVLRWFAAQGARLESRR